jgi:hypothetical protein
MDASTVLHAWDARREAAWAASDPRALRSLYVRGSRAAVKDVRLLRAYDARGLVVRRIVTQVFALRVLHRGRRHLRLWVFDRVAGGLVGSLSRGAQPLGTTPPRARVIELKRVDSTWRVVSVTARDPHAPPRRHRGR